MKRSSSFIFPGRASLLKASIMRVLHRQKPGRHIELIGGILIAIALSGPVLAAGRETPLQTAQRREQMTSGGLFNPNVVARDPSQHENGADFQPDQLPVTDALR
jgi:hypothetical protein